MPKDTTPEEVEAGLNALIDFVDLVLQPVYGDKGTAAIVVEFSRITPRTVLGMASPSAPEAYQALRTSMVEMLKKTAEELSAQEPVTPEEMAKAREAFELLFANTSATVQ